jgi:uridine kinase
MPRPVILGVVGDSAAGKTTITRGLVRVLGEDNVAHICTDDYHRYDRKQRGELGITPLHPDCNHLDIIAQHLTHLRRGETVLKPVYRHKDGTFEPPVYVRPERFTVIEGLLGYYLPEMRDVYDVRVYLNPPEELRRKWKVQRDCSRRARAHRPECFHDRSAATAPHDTASAEPDTRPTRCSQNSIAASPTQRRSSARSGGMPTCSCRSCRTSARKMTIKRGSMPS